MKYGSTVFTKKVSEMGESFWRKLSVNNKFLQTKNVSEACG